MFYVTFALKGREVHHTTLPFLPRADDHMIINGMTYIALKVEYDLSAHQGQNGSAIPARVVVRRKTDNDF